MELGDNPEAVGIDTIQIDKQGAETKVIVKVTSQSKLVSDTYTIVIQEKSSNNNLNLVKVNGEIASQTIDGTYKIGMKNETKELNIEATAEDIYAITNINENANNTYIAQIKENVIDGKTIYEYQIKIVAENGEEADYILEVEILEANYNIIKVEAGENAESLEEATLKEDGNYYYKINNVENAAVKVTTESPKSKVNVNGQLKDQVEVELQEDITEIPIIVIGEDGSSRQVYLIIEKKSSDTSIKDIIGEKVKRAEIEEDICIVYVNEDVEIVDLKIILNNELASIKLTEDADYTLKEIENTVDLKDYYTNGGATFIAYVKAEDGTKKEYTISIEKEANVELLSVVINAENIEYDEEKEKYEKIVPNGNKPQIVITASDNKQIVQLLDKEGNVLSSAIGALNITQTLSTQELTNDYIIKVISNHGEDFGAKEYDLSIIQKSKETGIIYVKVDGLGTRISEDGLTYSAQVAGKNTYPVEIKLVDEKATVRIEDLEGNILINEQNGILKGSLNILDGETKYFKIFVTSENGDIKEYNLNIERISSDTGIESITVTDLNEEETETIIRTVTSYDEQTKTYRIIVNNTIDNTDIVVKAKSEEAEITIDTSKTEKGQVTLNKPLLGTGTVKIPIKIVAPDGKNENRYLEIIQLSAEVRNT